MLVEEALATELLGTATITDLVGRRIYPVIAPQDVEAPYIVYSKISGVREHSHGGASHLANPRFQISIFAETYASAKAIAAAVQAKLQGYSGTMGGAGGVAVNGCFYDNEVDLYEEGTGLIGLALDFFLWHEE